MLNHRVVLHAIDATDALVDFHTGRDHREIQVYPEIHERVVEASAHFPSRPDHAELEKEREPSQREGGVKVRGEFAHICDSAQSKREC